MMSGTAIHIACSESQLEVIDFLIKKNIIFKKDRWGNLPWDDAPPNIQEYIQNLTNDNTNM